MPLALPCLLPVLHRCVVAAAWFAGWVAVWLLSGCSSPPVQQASVQALWRDQAYAAPGSPLPSGDALFAMSPEMRDFADTQVAASTRQRDIRLALVDALYRSPTAGSPGLRLAYDGATTRTAAEAFEAKAGNCLSLVMMTAAFATHLGLPVSFQAVRVDQHISRIGTLTLASGHVNLMLGARAGRYAAAGSEANDLVVDFLAPPQLHAQRTEPLTRSTIVAMYFNNRAAELLGQGLHEPAYWHAREALLHDPGFDHAANTLGVIHQRAGQLDAAEAAFRHVLARQPDAVASLSNLVGLLRLVGRSAEAEPLAERLAALQPVPPLHWLRLGRAALADGDVSTAVNLLRRELRRQPDQDEAHFVMAEALLRLGDLAGAQRHLVRAATSSQRRDDRSRYEAKLAHLRSQMQPGSWQ